MHQSCVRTDLIAKIWPESDSVYDLTAIDTRQGYQRAGTKADPAGLQREGLGGASQREAARDQILPERPTCLGADPVVAE